MDDFEAFIIRNADADIPRLLLSCKDWPIRKELAVSTIEARRKLSKKVPEWYSCTSLVYPSALSAEQCSSSATARYKAALAARITGPDSRIADLTGGLGVDSWAFSKEFSGVLYNDMNPSLVEAAAHNFLELRIPNIKTSNMEVSESTLPSILGGFNPDIIFLDPARRSTDGRKVFQLEDCSPDLLPLIPGLFACCRHILLKLSPMADISLTVEKLNRAYEAFLEKTSGEGWNGCWVREVHVIASGGECKELLVWMDREWNGPYSVFCCEDSGVLEFSGSELSSAKSVFPDSVYAGTLFEPGKSLTKAGVFNALCGRFNLVKLARSTHLYVHDSHPDGLSDSIGTLKEFGKVFDVLEILSLNKANMKDVGKRFPHLEVSARNIPFSSDDLRARLGVSSGDDAHIFGARIETPFDSGNFLIVCRRI